MELKKDKTHRGFGLITFTDRYGVECSIQKSSLATEDAIWFGCNEADPKILIYGEGWKALPNAEDVQCNTRMHLTRDQVAVLIPILESFVEYGEIDTK